MTQPTPLSPAGPDQTPGAPATPTRAQPAPLFEALAAQPWRWDFFVALRHVEAAHPQLPRLGQARRPGDEPVRLGQPPDMGFAPASLAAVAPGVAGGPARMDVRFLGLWGPNGPLPLHLTAQARERLLQHKDPTLVRFADLFHHRMLLLFYRAWAQALPVVQLDRPGQDRFADFVGSLIGTGGPAWRGRDAAPDHARLAFAGVLSRQVRNADGLAHMLSTFLKRPVRVESFVGRWMALPPQERSRLVGRAGGRARSSVARLGGGAVLGRAVFDRQHQCRIHIGPLDFSAFKDLLPGGSALAPVQALVQQYLGHELGWDLRLELQASQVPSTCLGRSGQLGWTSWIGQRRPGLPAALHLLPRVNAGRFVHSPMSSA
jgi:type VI secretion system protein ImpH